MIEIADIVDRESLEKWLLEQPEDKIKSLAVTLSFRLAMRVVPNMWLWTMNSAHASEHGLTALPFLRCDVIAGVANSNPTPAIKQAAAAAVNIYATNYTTTTAIYAASATFNTATKASYTTSFAATNASYAVNDDYIEIWDEIRNDCLILLDSKPIKNWPLWQDDADPLHDVWTSVKIALSNPTKDWQFWIDWYEAMLHGTPQNWDMLTEIALIDDAIWQAGLTAVNGAIADIQLKYALKATPNAEIMSINPDTGKLRVDTLSQMPQDHLREAVEKLENALNLFDFEGNASNQYLPIEAEWKIINSAVQQYSARPRMLHSACVRVAKRLQIKIDTGACPEPDKDADIDDFLTTVRTVSIDLFERDPLVKEAATFTAMTKLPELSQQQVETLIRAADELADGAEDVLKEETPPFARDMVNPELSEAERKEASYVTASRIFRAWALVKKMGVQLNSSAKSSVGFIKNSTTIYLWLEKAFKLLLEFFN